MKMTSQEAGRLGATKRWTPRYEMIKELSKYADSKQELDRLMRLRTPILIWITKTINYIKDGKASM